MTGERPTTAAEIVDAARDAAQQVASAGLHGDQATVVDIVQGFVEPRVLAVVLAQMVAEVHGRWARAAGVPVDESWRELMLDLEAWKAARRL